RLVPKGSVRGAPGGFDRRGAQLQGGGGARSEAGAGLGQPRGGVRTAPVAGPGGAGLPQGHRGFSFERDGLGIFGPALLPQRKSRQGGAAFELPASEIPAGLGAENRPRLRASGAGKARGRGHRSEEGAASRGTQRASDAASGTDLPGAEEVRV